jgi:Nuclease-related domain
MRIYKQSQEIRTIQQQKNITQANSSIANKEHPNPIFNISFFKAMSQIRDISVGNLGETFVGTLLRTLPDSWIMMSNVLIPTTKGTSTEIDRILIGNTGIYLIEIKTWKGSFSAYKDKWTRREGVKWVTLKNSPTEQSMYHKRIFSSWLSSKNLNIPNNSISAPVFFPVAQWIGAKECCVPVYTKFDDLFKLLNNNKFILSNDLVENIAQSITSVSLNDLDPAKMAEYRKAKFKIF